MASVPRRVRREGAWIPIEKGVSFAGATQQLRLSGYEVHATPSSRRVWFVPSTEAQPPLISVSSWVRSTGELAALSAPLQLVDAASSPGTGLDLDNPTKTGPLRDVLRTAA